MLDASMTCNSKLQPTPQQGQVVVTIRSGLIMVVLLTYPPCPPFLKGNGESEGGTVCSPSLLGKGLGVRC